MTKARIAFITAIYGSYDSSCKPFERQTVPADFICFTNRPNIKANGWIVDTTPYHDICRSKLDNGTQRNSLEKNRHTFNIAKYYKQAFQNINRLKEYDIVVWLDGSIEIIDSRAAEWLLKNYKEKKVIGWEHEGRNGNLGAETVASNFPRYTSTYWFNQEQPYQDVNEQYRVYCNNGYDEGYWKRIDPSRRHFGVWITCMIAFDNKSEEVSAFLDLWYCQTLEFTTQDQIGFPYAAQKTGLIPYTLPDNEIHATNPHGRTQFYIKHPHDA